VVDRPVVALPGLEEAGESAERRSLRFRRMLGRGADLAARRGELLGVAPGRNPAVGRAGAVDLLLESPVALDQAGVERVALGEAFEVLEAHARVEVVARGFEPI